MAENNTHYNHMQMPSDDQENQNNERTEGTPVIPLPFPGEGGPVDSGEPGPVLPDQDNGNMPVKPLPFPGEGGPVYPDIGFPSAPTTPSRPTIPGFPFPPVFPGFPGGSSQNFGQVRFLNASTNTFPVTITIDGNPYAINSRFGTISNYDWISDGFHTITVRRAAGIRSVLLQKNLPFAAGQKVTMVLTDSSSGNLELIRVVDTGCINMPYQTGCYRFANMSFSGSRFDLLLSNGETVFRNVGFQTVTSYKQAAAGTYQFLVTNANSYTFLKEIPIIVIGAVRPVTNVRQPLVTFSVDIHSGQNYTSYLIGNTWTDQGLRVITVED